jgi:hypothetical protein
MATNPRIPPRQNLPTLVAQRRKQSSAPLVAFGILAAAVILAAILYFMGHAPVRPNVPSNATVPNQPTENQVQLSDLRLSSAPTGGQMYIYARLSNAGQTAISGILMEVTFEDLNGRPRQSVTSRVESFSNDTAASLIDDPIKPGETRDVRMPIERTPADWNHQVPSIKVQDVTGIGRK